MSLTKEDIQALRKPFPLEFHSVREGPSNKDKTKCMWFVYLDRNAIAERLDDLFPGEWEFTMTEPIERAKHFSSVGRLVIKGIVREFNGAQEIDTNSWGKAWDDEKGCGTDTFRRVASMWGIGAYLSKAPDAWTPKPDKNNWDAQKAAKAEVLKRLGSWLSNTRKRPASNGEQVESTTEVKWPTKEQVGWVIDQFGNENEGLSQTEIFKLAKVSSFDDGDGWRKYDDAQAAVLHIQATFDAQLDNDNNDSVDGTVTSNGSNAVFAWKRYFVGDNGKKKYLELATVKPGNVKPDDEISFVMARAYGRSTDFKTMIGTLYDDNGLAKYETALKSTPWTKLKAPLGLVYEETKFYNTVTGMVKEEVVEGDIPF